MRVQTFNDYFVSRKILHYKDWERRGRAKDTEFAELDKSVVLSLLVV